MRISVNGSQILYWATRSYTNHNTRAANNPYTPQAACGSGYQVIAAFLEVEGGTRATDSGSFAYYAGPVKKSAAGRCVTRGGSVGSSSYTSPFEHCG